MSCGSAWSTLILQCFSLAVSIYEVYIPNLRAFTIKLPALFTTFCFYFSNNFTNSCEMHVKERSNLHITIFASRVHCHNSSITVYTSLRQFFHQLCRWALGFGRIAILRQCLAQQIDDILAILQPIFPLSLNWNRWQDISCICMADEDCNTFPSCLLGKLASLSSSN